jgi:hypothetical protein
MRFEELTNEVLGAIEFHDELNPLLWQDNRLKPDVSNKLLKIAKFFMNFLDIPDLNFTHITISGSNAAYTYTNKSDIDLHILVDVPKEQQTFMRNFFDAKKTVFNNQHEITIKGHPVELYVQFTDQPHVSAGIYNLIDKEWIAEPKKQKADINDVDVRSKAVAYINAIEDVFARKDIDAASKLWDKIKEDRKNGLEKAGELGTENLVFKVLRNAGFIGILQKFKQVYADRDLSLDQ